MNSKAIAIIMISAFICLPANHIDAAPKDVEKEFSDSEAPPYYEKGNGYLKDGRCYLAIEEYNKAVKIAPDYYGLYNKLGYAHYYCGRFEEALGYFRKSLSLNRGNVDTIIGIANVYMALKQEPEARHYFEKVIEMDPDNTAPLMPLALIYAHKNMLVEAQSLLKKVLENHPRLDSAYFLLAQDQELLNELDAAIENYKKILELTPGYVKAYLGLTRCYMIKGKYNTAYNYAKAAQKFHFDVKEVDDMIRSLKRKFREDKKTREKKMLSENKNKKGSKLAPIEAQRHK